MRPSPALAWFIIRLHSLSVATDNQTPVYIEKTTFCGKYVCEQEVATQL